MEMKVPTSIESIHYLTSINTMSEFRTFLMDKNKCPDCQGLGYKHTRVKMPVHIPAGISNSCPGLTLICWLPPTSTRIRPLRQ